MNKLALVLTVGAAALFVGSAASAADNTVKSNSSAGVAQRATDLSSQGRYYRGYGYRGYRPHYGYGPRPYYGRGYGYGGPVHGQGYGYGGPSVSFGFGGGRGYY